MPMRLLMICAVPAFTGIVTFHCVADPITTNSASAKPPPLSELLSTNLSPVTDGTNAPLILVPSNSPARSFGNPTAPVRGPKLAAPSDLSSSFNLTPSSETSFPTRQPGIYLSSPYAMQVKVPDAMDAGMVHSPSDDWNLDNPVHNPGLELKKP